MPRAGHSSSEADELVTKSSLTWHKVVKKGNIYIYILCLHQSNHIVMNNHLTEIWLKVYEDLNYFDEPCLSYTVKKLHTLFAS